MASQPKSRRSGGPKTEMGKLISSRNSTRSGVYAKLDLLANEEPNQFALVEKLFIDDLKPVGMVESLLVQSLAKISWKKFRLEQTEARVLSDLLAKLPSLSELLKAGIDHYLPSAEPYVVDPSSIEALDGKAIRQVIWILEELKHHQFNEEQIANIEVNNPKVYRQLKGAVDQIVGEDSSHFDMAHTKYYWDAPSTPIADATEQLIARYEGELWAIDNQEKLLNAKQVTDDKRAFEFLKENSTQRAHDDLDRAYSRLLKEFRAQQTWRKNQSVIKGEAKKILSASKPKKK